jgi:hypothetical protein
MYKHLIDDVAIVHDQILWRLKLHLKIKILIWLLNKKVIFTKDNLIRRRWQRKKIYCFCSEEETIQHLVFYCPCVKFLWRIIFYNFWFTPSFQCCTHVLFLGKLRVDKTIKHQILVGSVCACVGLYG